MLDYVKETLHVPVIQQPCRLSTTLPLYLRKLFDYEEWTVFNVSFIVAKPHEHFSVKTLQKHMDKLQSAASLPVVFAYDDATKYRSERLVEAGIPFIVDGHQIYLPFLGVALKQRHDEGLVHRVAKNEVSIQTQRFILKVLYDGWTDINVTDASKRLGVSKITLTRVFDELEALNSDWVTANNRLRMFHLDTDKETFWHEVFPHLFNPVVREYRLAAIPTCEHLTLSGMSAISHHSMLADNPWPTYAITKAQERELELKDGQGLTEWEEWNEPACIVQVMRYALDSIGEATIDPLSAILSLHEKDREDPRVTSEVEDIMERVFQQ